MGEIVWLASYPKSGNTWTRAFLTQYLADEEDDLDINHLAKSPISSNRFLFDHSVGVEAASLLPDEIDNLRAAVFRHIASQQNRCLFMKTHEVWHCTTAGAPIFPADVTRGVVYIVRNPLDVAVSSAHHFTTTLADAVAALNDESYTLVRSQHATFDQLPQLVRSWHGHVQSWLDESGLPCHLMRYEEMLADPVGSFGKMVCFAGLEYDEARVVAAVAATSFEALRSQELAKGFLERPRTNTGFFFREGRTGGWRAHLAQGLVESILANHGPTMQRLGYLNTQGQLLV